jgi:ABC-2 type transport system permease protein
MKWREFCRFEILYQLRRVRIWLYLSVLFVVAFLLTQNNIDEAREGGALVGSPYAIAAATVISNMLWVVMATAVAGNAAARDRQTQMHPLVFTTPVRKADYLGGRFLAAFVLNALTMLAVPLGILSALLVFRVETEIRVSFSPAAYISAYLLIALPAAFAATALQFSLATLSRRAVASYLASIFFFLSGIVAGAVAEVLQMPTLGKLLDPVGFFTVVGTLSRAWTPIEKNTLLVGLEASMLATRAVWLGIGLCLLAFTHYRFRFSHPTSARPWRIGFAWPARKPRPEAVSARPSSRRVEQTFGVAMHARQTLLIARDSFRAIATSRVGLVFLCLLAMIVSLGVWANLQRAGVPFVPRTERILMLVTSALTNSATPWVIIPLLTVFWAGELVWRERDAGLAEMTDAAPVPEWVLFLGKFLGLGLILVAWTALLTMAGMLAQMVRGYFQFEISLYLRALFGLQLAEYLLFAVLAFAIHIIVSEKYLGYFATLTAYALIAFAPRLGIEHRLLVYGSDPGWFFSDMRGFGASLAPWMWFKAYWAAWAVLLAVIARLLWMRGKDGDLRTRLQLARHRFAGATAGVAAAAAALILALGGFIFYNTNVLNAYDTAADRTARSVEYERRYRQYEEMPQPRLTTTTLQVEIYPERREAQIRGTYHLVNNGAAVIRAVHLSTAEQQVETRAVSLDRPLARTLEDETLGYRIYDLEQPLEPGDSLRLTFEVSYRPRGFRNSGAAASVVANGTYFTNLEWLPAIGYQRNRELTASGLRRLHGLAARSALPSLDEADEYEVRAGGAAVSVEAIVGTSDDQIAIGPGTLLRTWTAPSTGSGRAGRRYFQYATEAPIGGRYAFFSARYAVHQDVISTASPSTGSRQVAIQVYHHPTHAGIVDRMTASVKATLDYCTKQLGPYPYSNIRLIENPTRGMGAHAESTTVDYGDDFSLLNSGPADLDLVFAVVAHETAHQWWGMQVGPAPIEGSGLLVEGLATYTAIELVETALGPEQLRRYLGFMREEVRAPRTRAAAPLLRAADRFAYYRRGPFALYAMREYIGKDRMDAALRQIFEKHRSGTPPLPTSLDLYRELEAVTPQAFQSLLSDLFEKNTFWALETERVAAKQADAGTWQVTLNVRARKRVVDENGIETEVPMDDPVDIGVFAARAQSDSNQMIYLQKHRIRSGAQTITVTVPAPTDGGELTRAGIDPKLLLNDWDTEDNVKAVRAQP